MTEFNLVNELKKYEVLSLAKAIYTITSWLPNRNYLGLVDSLNRTFIQEEENIAGIQQISTYKDFRVFFEIVSSMLKEKLSTIYHEPFPVDKGYVQFYSNGKFQKIFIGNGSESTYEACFLIDSIVQEDDYLKLIWKEILNYEDLILTTLSVDNELQSTEFQCPPEEYFNLVFENYNLFSNPQLSRFFQDFKSYNEELYDFFTPENNHPIFLPLLKESFLEKTEKDLSSEKIAEFSWIALIKQLNENFLLIEDRGLNALFSIMFVKEDNEKVKYDRSFALFGENKVVIFLPNESDSQLIDSLKKDIKFNNCNIAGYSPQGSLVGVEIPADGEVFFQKVAEVDISPNISKFMSFSANDETYIDVTSLMGIINFAVSTNEIIEFIVFMNNQSELERMMNNSGITSQFQIWQDMNQVIVEGATETMVIVPPYQSVEKTMELFEKDLYYYPYNASASFSNIHNWNTNLDVISDLSLVCKGHSGSADIFISEDKNLIYQEFHFIIDDMERNMLGTFNSFHEIILNGFSEFKEIILSQYQKDILEVNLVSEEVLEKNAKNKVIHESKYCKKIIINETKNNQILLIRPYWNEILRDNISVLTKSFENDLIFSFLKGANFKDERVLESYIKMNDDGPRTSSISQLSVPYFIEPNSTFSPPELSAFKNVRKVMAHTIKSIGLDPQDYNEGEMLGVIKHFRNDIRNDLIVKLKGYNKSTLHKNLLNIYSAVLFQINLNHERLKEFNKNNNIQQDALEEFKERTIKLREEAKIYRYVLEYLIEENLINKKANDLNTPTRKDLEELIAHAKWILDFQSISDAISYGAIGWNKLSIREDYLIEIEGTDKYFKNATLLKELRYNYGDYSYRDSSFDQLMFEKVDKSFQADTGLSLRSLITTLTFLFSNNYVSELIDHPEVSSVVNIIEVPIDVIHELFVNETKLPIEEFYKVLSFITIETENIPDDNGVIPVWEKKKRKHKFSAQPILVEANKLIYSPISLYELEKSWREGIMSFLLPYNTGLENTIETIAIWKKNYEAKIVDDLAELFTSPIYETYPDKELYKLDSKGNHPRDLGDFDLIVINKKEKEVLLFEVKYMRLSQTMKDFLGDQSQYFTKRKAKAKKFERRTLYFKENLNRIMMNLGYEEKFKMKSYFLANKNIRSFFKEYSFEVIGFNEFKAKQF